MFGNAICVTISRLLNGLKPGTIRKVNRLPTPLAGMVSGCFMFHTQCFISKYLFSAHKMLMVCVNTGKLSQVNSTHHTLHTTHHTPHTTHHTLHTTHHTPHTTHHTPHTTHHTPHTTHHTPHTTQTATHH